MPEPGSLQCKLRTRRRSSSAVALPLRELTEPSSLSALLLHLLPAAACCAVAAAGSISSMHKAQLEVKDQVRHNFKEKLATIFKIERKLQP